MRDNDLTDRIGVDQTDVEDKGNEMVVQNDGLEVEVDGDEGPGGEIREEAVQGGNGVFGFLATSLHHVESALGCQLLLCTKGVVSERRTFAVY